MPQWYDVGLQAGKKVAEAVDAFIEQEHKGNKRMENFDPDKTKVLSDGSKIYRWNMKWDPSWFDDEKRFVAVLFQFNDENLPDEDTICENGEDFDDYAYKLVAVGDEGGQDKICNSYGDNYFDGIYNDCSVTYPDEFHDNPPEKIYVYKEYCDDNAYGEEIIELYQNRAKAEKRLKDRIEETYGLSWDDIPDEYDFDENDTFKPDYVSICHGDCTSFWIVEEKEVI